MLGPIKRVGTQIADAWCHVMHPAPMWPVAGYYICPLCQRRHRVKFELPLETEYRRKTAERVNLTTAREPARVHAEVGVRA